MNKGDWQSSLQAFLNSNPDLPEGEEIKESDFTIANFTSLRDLCSNLLKAFLVFFSFRMKV